MIKYTENDLKTWLEKSEENLNVAKLLFKNKYYNHSLYNLQQSNEKLTKTLLLRIGILSSNSPKDNFFIKSIFGFYPKKPSAYRHKIIRPLMSDLQKMLPTMQEIVDFFKKHGMDEKFSQFQTSIKKSKKSIYKLKKRSYRLIETNSDLENQLKPIKSIFSRYNDVNNEISETLDKFEFNELYLSAKDIVAKEGFDVSTAETPNFLELKHMIIFYFQMAFLLIISLSIGSFLNPLEAVTRYPDSKTPIFDLENPYVKNFQSIHEVVEGCLKETKKLLE